MADTYISMQQATPSGSGESTLYTVPAGASFVSSSIIICNTNAVPVTLTMRIGNGGAGASTEQYILSAFPLSANGFMTMTLGITMTAGDVLYVSASTSGVAFQVGGVQVS